jgi:hypothetical protein
MRAPAPPSSPPLDALPPSPAVLSRGRDAASIRAALVRFARPLVCECGAVEGAPGASPVAVLVRPIRNGAASVEAVCAACAPDARQLVSLGALPPSRPARGARRPPVATVRPAAEAVTLTLATSRATGDAS